MSLTSIEAKLSDGDRVFTTSFDFGENTADAITKFGEETVFTKFKQAATIDLQALIRRNLKVNAETGEAKSDAQILEAIEDWKPGAKQVTRRSPAEKAREAISKMSPEDKMVLLAEVEEELAAA